MGGTKMVIPLRSNQSGKEHDATITGQKLTLTTHPAGGRRSETNMGGVEDVSIDLVLHNPEPAGVQRRAEAGYLARRRRGFRQRDPLLTPTATPRARGFRHRLAQPGTWGVDDEGTRSWWWRPRHPLPA